jgi:hypothetical protein
MMKKEPGAEFKVEYLHSSKKVLIMIKGRAYQQNQVKMLRTKIITYRLHLSLPITIYAIALISIRMTLKNYGFYMALSCTSA